MAEKIVSPGVYTNEIDQSFLPAALGPIGAAIVGPTVKGPVLTPTVVSSYSEYVQTFGEAIISGSDSYQYLTSHTAKEYLKQGGPCTIVRVSKPNTNRATAVVGGAVTGGVTAVKSSNTITFSATHPVTTSTVTFKVGGATAQGIKFIDGAGTNELTFTGNEADVYVDNFLDENFAESIAEHITGLVNSISDMTATNDGGVITVEADAATTGNDIVIAGTGTHNTTIGTATAGVTGVAGTDTSFFTLEALGDGPAFNNTGSIGATNNILTQLTSSAATNDHWTSGSFGGRATNYRWEISQRNTNKGTFTLLIETYTNLSLDNESPDYILKRIGNYKEELYAEDGVVYLRDEADSEFPNKSKYVRVKALNVKTPNYLDNAGNITQEYSDNPSSFLPALGSGSYDGAFGDVKGGTKQTAGDFGDSIEHPFKFYDNITNTNVQGVKMVDSAVKPSGASVGGGYGAAISLLKNKDQYDFNLLFLPGIIDQLGAHHNGIIGDAIQLCEDRGDCFLVYDNTSKTSTVATAKTNTEARNSSYAATYFPWVQIQDASLGVYRYVPPSVVMAGVYHFNDVIGQPWFAPAGLNRGGIDSAVQAYKKLSQSQRDDLYDSNMNPIATFPGQGVTAFGQKTTQKKASALDRVNVRRLLIDVKKFVARSSKSLVFEQNTTDLRNQFLNVVNPYMEQVQANSGLNAFRVIMDDTNNTPDTIDRNMLIGQIFLQPTKTAEFIVLDFVVQPTGAEFPE